MSRGSRSPSSDRKGHPRTLARGKGETMTRHEMPRVIGVRHVGLSAHDPAALAEFYHDVLGLQAVGGSAAGASAFGATAFLSSHPAEESHDLALSPTPPTSTPPSRCVLCGSPRRVPAGPRPERAGQDGFQPRCVYCLLLRGPGGAPDRGLLAYGRSPGPSPTVIPSTWRSRRKQSSGSRPGFPRPG